MRLDDFHIKAITQRARCDIEQLERDIDPDAEVGRHRDADITRALCDGPLFAVAESRGADDELHTEFAAHGQMRERAFRTREIDQHVATGEHLRRIVADDDAAALACQLTGVFADKRITRLLERGTKLCAIHL